MAVQVRQLKRLVIDQHEHRIFGTKQRDTEDLRTFVEVADAGGVSPAAFRLGVSKSIVSRRLLPAGELRGRLRVALPLTFGPTHLAPVLADLARRHPQLHVHTCYSDRFLDLVSKGYDCAIRVGYLQDSSLIARRFAPIYGKLVASPDYIQTHGSPETPEELANHHALMQGTETWQLLDGEKVITVRSQGRFKADNGAALIAAAIAGLGIGYLPDWLTDAHVESGALVPVMTRHPLPPAGAYVVRPPGQHPSRKVRVLTDLLIEHCGRL